MKKSFLLLAAAMLGAMLFTACEKEQEQEFPHFTYDKSLAGSVACDPEIIRFIEGSYDGVPFEDGSYPRNYGILYIEKVSDSEILMDYCYKWDEETQLTVSIPVTPLTGKSYDVTFDHTASDVTIEYNQKRYTKVNASVKGWIKNISFLKTRTSPIPSSITCGITIECEIDSKKLIFNISENFD